MFSFSVKFQNSHRKSNYLLTFNDFVGLNFNFRGIITISSLLDDSSTGFLTSFFALLFERGMLI